MVTNWKVVSDEGTAVTLVPTRKIIGLSPETVEFVGFRIGQMYTYYHFIVAGSIGFGPELYNMKFDGTECKVLDHNNTMVLSYNTQEHLAVTKMALGLAKSLRGSENLLPDKIGLNVQDLVTAWETYIAVYEKEEEK